MNNLPDNPMSMLRLMPSRVKEIASFSKGIIDAVRNGNASALEALVMLRAVQLMSKEVIEQIESNVLNEANRYNEKSIEMFGAKIEKCDVKTEYLYETSGDSQWEELDAEIKTLTARKKEREEFLRVIKDPVLQVNKDGAEELVKPPVKRTKEGVKVYLKS
jgi:hypothetical protein